METGKRGEKPHVALLAFPFGSHATPLLTLGRHLAGLAGDVKFSFFTTAASLKPISSLVSACSGNPNMVFCTIPDGLPEDFAFSPERPQEDIEHFLRSAPDDLRRALAGMQPPVSCVLADSFLHFAQDLADEAGVPLISFWASAASSLITHIYTDRLREKFGVVQALTPENRDIPVDCIPSLPFLRLQDLQEGIVSGSRDSVFSVLLHNMAKVIPRAAAVLANTFESLEPFSLTDLRTKLNACLTIAPLFLLSPPPPPASSPAAGDHGCISFLDSHLPNSVVYLSFGSVADFRIPKHEIAALAEGLESSGAPFLWSLKPEKQADLPAGFVDRVKGRGLMVPWAPQLAVLRHASLAVFISHGGWNSILETIAGGVPLICRPVFGDHPINSRLVDISCWGVGVTVRDGTFTKESVEEAIRLVLREQVGKALREKASHHWKRLICEAVSADGSSTKNINALVEMMAELGKLCTQESPQDRPPMRSVVVALMALSSSSEDWDVGSFYENEARINLMAGRLKFIYACFMRRCVLFCG
ncbi:anthocyanidin 3-O-glucosyltransferase 7-like isoform X2 [Nymphaea colorata]|uniref:anthocyanidin 3-O-glucosyltransferase 7-like isoform X2 n=1 Tax=Nymphaea colorata TaxID=210225 RepID=UPI00129E3231|nr:anthocyanidin 3-O-glucosyltransferase 7-like isoform X2 [Nymphaea colorata]